MFFPTLLTSYSIAIPLLLRFFCTDEMLSFLFSDFTKIEDSFIFLKERYFEIEFSREYFIRYYYYSFEF